MKRVPKMNAKVVIVPHDGGTNQSNPYDHLTLEERHEKILHLCARIYLRMRSRQSVLSTRGPSPASSGTPGAAA